MSTMGHYPRGLTLDALTGGRLETRALETINTSVALYFA